MAARAGLQMDTNMFHTTAEMICDETVRYKYAETCHTSEDRCGRVVKQYTDTGKPVQGRYNDAKHYTFNTMRMVQGYGVQNSHLGLGLASSGMLRILGNGVNQP